MQEIGAMLFLVAIIAAWFSPSECLTNEVTESLGRLSRQIALQYFMESRCLAVITEDSVGILDYIQALDVPTFHVQLTRKLRMESERLTPETEFEEYAWDNSFLTPMDAGCPAFIIQTSDVNFMVQTFARLAHSPRSIHRANRKFLYLPAIQFPDSEFEADLQELYGKREMDFMPDMVVAKVINQTNATTDYKNISPEDTAVEEVSIELITHRYVGPDPTERISLDTWTLGEGFSKNANLYPDKTTNMMGKEVTLTAIFYPPYSAVYPDTDPPVYDGLEFRIMSAWADEHNLTWRVLYKPNDWWGEIYNNGSGWGLSGHVSMDKADVAFGAIYLWENEHHYTDYTSVYFRASLTIVHPRPKLLPGWTVIISPFNMDMWAAVWASVVIVTLALHITSQNSMRLLEGFQSYVDHKDTEDAKAILTRAYKNKLKWRQSITGADYLGSGRGKAVVNMYSTWVECAFRTMGLLVLQVPPDERDFSTPRHVPMRHLVTWIILFYFVLTTGYSAGLASVLTLPRYEKPLDTPSDMAEHNAKWGAMDECFVFFLRESLDPVMLSMTKTFVLADEAYFTAKAKAKSRDMGFAIEKLQNGHFALPPYVNEETMRYLRLMKEDYVTAHCVFMVRKGSPYRDGINKVVRKLRDRGVILYWEDMAVRNYMSTRDQLAVASSRYEIDTGPTQLLLRHTTGSFYILGYGMILSLVTFILELLRHNLGQSKITMLKKKGKDIQTTNEKYLHKQQN